MTETARVIEVDREEEDIKLFMGFLYRSSVLILDPSRPSAQRLSELLAEIGARIENINICDNYQQALSTLEELRPDILISEYYLHGEDVFSLFKRFKEIRPDQNNCLIIMVTSNTSQAYVAKAAEEELDAFLIKPYRSDFIKQMLFESTISKINPGQYLKMVEMARVMILEGKLAEAKSLLVEAMTLVEEPTLALYYQGQIELLEGADENAKGKFRAGLELSEVHFKSLEALFQNYIDEGLIHDAYEVIRKMITYFPFNTDRLAQVLKLSVMTENYLDIEDYYKVYKDSEIEDNTLKKYICAALITMGKFYLGEKQIIQAIEAFKRASSLLTDAIFLRNIIESLCDVKLSQDASYFLNLFIESEKDSEHFKICRFLINALTLKSLDDIISEGKSLVYKDFIHSKMVYKFLYHFLQQAKDDVEIANLKKKFEIPS